jgi:hypothetical protein
MSFGPAGNPRFPGSGGPRGPQKPPRKDAGLRPASFCICFEAQRAPQTSEIDDFRPAQNSCIKNPGVIGGQINAGNARFLSLGGPGGPGKPCQKVGDFAPPPFRQGFQGSRGRPDSKKSGFPVSIWPPVCRQMRLGLRG